MGDIRAEGGERVDDLARQSEAVREAVGHVVRQGDSKGGFARGREKG